MQIQYQYGVIGGLGMKSYGDPNRSILSYNYPILELILTMSLIESISFTGYLIKTYVLLSGTSFESFLSIYLLSSFDLGGVLVVLGFSLTVLC